MKLSKRWSVTILLVIAVCLPLRFAQAAQNWCPWMQTSTNSTLMVTDMPDCEGISKADGHCNLQVVCAAVPLLIESDPRLLPLAATMRYTFIRLATRTRWWSPPEPIPIS